jgi:hypothetical protein
MSSKACRRRVVSLVVEFMRSRGGKRDYLLIEAIRPGEIADGGIDPPSQVLEDHAGEETVMLGFTN